MAFLRGSLGPADAASGSVVGSVNFQGSAHSVSFVGWFGGL